jgi:dethiobiotin synthetase
VRDAIILSGTDTGVGKTWVAARLAEALRRRGDAIAVRKPVQSFNPDDGPTDAEILAAASGTDPTAVCPAHRWYEIPLAPPMAAEALGRPPIEMRALVDEMNLPAEGITLIEGVGGARSPVTNDGDNVALAGAINAALVILVAPAALGAINAVRLGADAFAPAPVIVFLNRFDATDDTHARNLEWLRNRDGFDLCTSIPELAEEIAARRIANPKDEDASAPMEVG